MKIVNRVSYYEYKLDPDESHDDELIRRLLEPVLTDKGFKGEASLKRIKSGDVFHKRDVLQARQYLGKYNNQITNHIKDLEKMAEESRCDFNTSVIRGAISGLESNVSQMHELRQFLKDLADTMFWQEEKEVAHA